MKLCDMKANCRKCGKELKGDSKDADFITFYCMKCGIYTSKPVEDYQDQPESAAMAAPPLEKCD